MGRTKVQPEDSSTLDICEYIAFHLIDGWMQMLYQFIKKETTQSPL